MNTMDWIENNIAETFNEERDLVARTLTEQIEKACNHDVYDMEFGNWNDVTIKSDRNEDEDAIIHITSSKNEDGVITVVMNSQDALFDGDISVDLDEITTEAFNKTMVLGQLWDVYNHIVAHPVPDLIENYNSLELPPAPSKRL